MMNVLAIEIIGSIIVIVHAVLGGRRTLSVLRQTPMTAEQVAQNISCFKSGIMIWFAFVIFFTVLPFSVGSYHSWLLTCALSCSILSIYIPSLIFLRERAREF
jgi:hypothetical protein